jgi:rRNA maturation endonuclease Nob1
MDANFIQKRMNEMQQSDEFAATMGKLLSGRPGYRPVIEKKMVVLKCKGCNVILDESEKFCHECGMKVVKQ